MPPISIADFNRWKIKESIVIDCDMEPDQIVEAKDFISSGIEKNSG